MSHDRTGPVQNEASPGLTTGGVEVVLGTRAVHQVRVVEPGAGRHLVHRGHHLHASVVECGHEEADAEVAGDVREWVALDPVVFAHRLAIPAVLVAAELRPTRIVPHDLARLYFGGQSHLAREGRRERVTRPSPALVGLPVAGGADDRARVVASCRRAVEGVGRRSGVRGSALGEVVADHPKHTRRAVAVDPDDLFSTRRPGDHVRATRGVGEDDPQATVGVSDLGTAAASVTEQQPVVGRREHGVTERRIVGAQRLAERLSVAAPESSRAVGRDRRQPLARRRYVDLEHASFVTAQGA